MVKDSCVYDANCSASAALYIFMTDNMHFTRHHSIEYKRTNAYSYGGNGLLMISLSWLYSVSLLKLCMLSLLHEITSQVKVYQQRL